LIDQLDHATVFRGGDSPPTAASDCVAEGVYSHPRARWRDADRGGCFADRNAALDQAAEAPSDVVCHVCPYRSACRQQSRDYPHARATVRCSACGGTINAVLIAHERSHLLR
jgi:hypothetical protein